MTILPDFENYYNKLLLNRFNDTAIKAFFTEDIQKQTENKDSKIMERYICGSLKGVRALQFIDMNTFMVDDILTKVDRASMPHSLEIRVPFLDHELVESIWRLPEKQFPSNSVEKPILKKLMKNQLPDEIFKRNKQGFSAPVNRLKGFSIISNSLTNGILVKEGIVNSKFIHDLNNNKYPNSDAMIWMIILFEKWYSTWAK